MAEFGGASGGAAAAVEQAIALTKELQAAVRAASETTGEVTLDTSQLREQVAQAKAALASLPLAGEEAVTRLNAAFGGLSIAAVFEQMNTQLGAMGSRLTGSAAGISDLKASLAGVVTEQEALGAGGARAASGISATTKALGEQAVAAQKAGQATKQAAADAAAQQRAVNAAHKEAVREDASRNYASYYNDPNVRNVQARPTAGAPVTGFQHPDGSYSAVRNGTEAYPASTGQSVKLETQLAAQTAATEKAAAAEVAAAERAAAAEVAAAERSAAAAERASAAMVAAAQEMRVSSKAGADAHVERLAGQAAAAKAADDQAYAAKVESARNVTASQTQAANNRIAQLGAQAEKQAAADVSRAHTEAIAEQQSRNYASYLNDPTVRNIKNTNGTVTGFQHPDGSYSAVTGGSSAVPATIGQQAQFAARQQAAAATAAQNPFIRGLTSGGQNGSMLERAGNVTAYTLEYEAVRKVQEEIKNTIDAVLDYKRAMVDLNVAIGDNSSSNDQFASSLNSVARLAGENVASAIETATAGIRAFGAPGTGQQNSALNQAIGTSFAQATQVLSAMTKESLTQTSEDLIGIAGAYNTDSKVGPGQLQRINDAVANARNLGGDPQRIAEGVGKFAEVSSTSGISPEESAAMLSIVTARQDESGTLAAQRLSQIVAQAGSSSGQAAIRDLGALTSTRIDTNAPFTEQLGQMSVAYGKLTESEKREFATRIGGNRQLREFLTLMNENSRITETVANQKPGASSKFYDQLTNSFPGLLLKIRGDLHSIETEFGRTKLLDGFGAALYPVEFALHAIVDLGHQFNRIYGPIREVLGVVLDLTIAMKALSLVQGFMASSALKVAAAQTAEAETAGAAAAAETGLAGAGAANTLSRTTRLAAGSSGFFGRLTSPVLKQKLGASSLEEVGPGLIGAGVGVRSAATSIRSGLASAPSTLRKAVNTPLGALAAVGITAEVATQMSDSFNNIQVALKSFDQLTKYVDSLDPEKLKNASADYQAVAEKLNKSSSGVFGSIVDFMTGHEARNDARTATALAELAKHQADVIEKAVKKSVGEGSLEGDAGAFTFGTDTAVQDGLNTLAGSGRSATAQINALSDALETLMARAAGHSEALNTLQRAQVTGGFVADVSGGFGQLKSDTAELGDGDLGGSSPVVGLKKWYAHYQDILGDVDVTKFTSAQQKAFTKTLTAQGGKFDNSNQGVYLKALDEATKNTLGADNYKAIGETGRAQIHQVSLNALRQAAAAYNAGIVGGVKDGSVDPSILDKTIASELQLAQQAGGEAATLIKAGGKSGLSSNQVGASIRNDLPALAAARLAKLKAAGLTPGTNGIADSSAYEGDIATYNDLLRTRNDAIKALHADDSLVTKRQTALDNLPANASKDKVKTAQDALKKAQAAQASGRAHLDEANLAIASTIDAGMTEAEKQLGLLDESAKASHPHNSMVSLAQAVKTVQAKIKIASPDELPGLRIELANAQNAAVDGLAAQADALRTDSVSPNDALGSARAAAANAAAAVKRLYGDRFANGKSGALSKEYLDAQKTAADTAFTVQQQQVAKANARDAASVGTGDTVGDAAEKVREAARTLAITKGKGAEFFTALKALRDSKQSLASAENDRANAKEAVGIASDDVLGNARLQIDTARRALAIAAANSPAYYQALKALQDGQQAYASAQNDTANAQEAAGLYTGDAAGQARLQIDTARRALAIATANSPAYYQAVKALADGKVAYAAAQVSAANVNEQLSIDLTNPVQAAREQLDAARRKLASDRRTGADGATLNSDQLGVDQAQSAEKAAAFSQRLSDAQTAEHLGRISHAAYMSFLHSQHDNLTEQIKGMSSTSQGYRQAVDELNQVDGLLKDAAGQMDGQWNIGGVKLPTEYEVRSSIAAHSGTVAGTQTVVFNVNGADLGAVKQLIGSYIGPAALTRRSSTPRKVG